MGAVAKKTNTCPCRESNSGQARSSFTGEKEGNKE
jgi:hypothetical protein